jgi:hypothetical protein
MSWASLSAWQADIFEGVILHPFVHHAALHKFACKHVSPCVTSRKGATELNLSGTQLVTLSACSTGLGSQATGEGVYGLQRYLRVAVARTSLLTLREVDDAAAKACMLRYYSLLMQGMGRADALRKVQRQIRDFAPWSHPHFWASWQLKCPSRSCPPLHGRPDGRGSHRQRGIHPKLQTGQPVYIRHRHRRCLAPIHLQRLGEGHKPQRLQEWGGLGLAPGPSVSTTPG